MSYTADRDGKRSSLRRPTRRVSLLCAPACRENERSRPSVSRAVRPLRRRTAGERTGRLVPPRRPVADPGRRVGASRASTRRRLPGAVKDRGCSRWRCRRRSRAQLQRASRVRRAPSSPRRWRVGGSVARRGRRRRMVPSSRPAVHPHPDRSRRRDLRVGSERRGHHDRRGRVLSDVVRPNSGSRPSRAAGALLRAGAPGGGCVMAR